MSLIRVGSTSTYADGWEQIFGGGGKAGTRKTAAKRPAKKAARKKPTGRKAAAKKPTKKPKSRGR